MKRGSWLLGLVVVAFAYSSPSFAEGGVALDSSEEEGESLVKPTDPHQLPLSLMTSDVDQEASATELGSYSNKFYKGGNHGYHNSLGHIGSKDYHDNESYKKNRHGDYGKNHRTNYYDKGGELYYGHGQRQNQNKNSHEGYKGSAGHLSGSKGHSNKGHENSGFENLYHKEEYGLSKKFYDDKAIGDYLDKDDHVSINFNGHEAGFIGGSEYEGRDNKNHFADKGVYNQGRHFKSKDSQKSSHGTIGYHGDDSSYANKGGFHNKNDAYDFQGLEHDVIHDGDEYDGNDHHDGQGYKNFNSGHKSAGYHNPHSHDNHHRDHHRYGGYDDGHRYGKHNIIHQGGYGMEDINRNPWGSEEVYTGYEPARYDTRFKHPGSLKRFEPQLSLGDPQTGNHHHKFTRPHLYKGQERRLPQRGQFATGYSNFNVRRHY